MHTGREKVLHRVETGVGNLLTSQPERKGPKTASTFIDRSENQVQSTMTGQKQHFEHLKPRATSKTRSASSTNCNLQAYFCKFMEMVDCS